MNVNFVDTSILLNLLGVPGRSDEQKSVMQQYKQKSGEVFVLPIATLVETGNHISHSDPKRNYEIAEKFRDLVLSAAEGKNGFCIGI